MSKKPTHEEVVKYLKEHPVPKRYAPEGPLKIWFPEGLKRNLETY